jgi:hypothetical protein
MVRSRRERDFDHHSHRFRFLVEAGTSRSRLGQKIFSKNKRITLNSRMVNARIETDRSQKKSCAAA